MSSRIITGHVIYNPAYTYKFQLKTTLVTEKKFHCDKCDFKTKTAKNLTIHKQRRHEGVKTEVCHICGSSFFDKVGLSIHMNGVHVEGSVTSVVEF